MEDARKTKLDKVRALYDECESNASLSIGEFNKRMLDLVVMIAEDLYGNTDEGR